VDVSIEFAIGHEIDEIVLDFSMAVECKLWNGLQRLPTRRFANACSQFH
jgi:hypothetical protein